MSHIRVWVTAYTRIDSSEVMLWRILDETEGSKGDLRVVRAVACRGPLWPSWLDVLERSLDIEHESWEKLYHACT